MEEHSLTADLLESELTIEYRDKLRAYIKNHPLHFSYVPDEDHFYSEGYIGTKKEIAQKLTEDVLNSDEDYKNSIMSFCEHFPGHKEHMYNNFYLTNTYAIAQYNLDDYFN